MTLQYGVMLSYHIPGRPATPHTFSHLTDTSVASSRSGVVAGSLGPPGVASRAKANLLQPHCSRGENRLKNSHHRTAAASHTERLESESRVNCSVGIVASTSGKGNFKGPKRQFASDLGVEEQQKGLENPPEAGILPDALVSALDTNVEEETKAQRRATNAAASTSRSLNAAFASNGGILFHPSEQSQIKESWKHLMRWSRAWRTVEDGTGILKDIDKVVVFGGGSFGTAIACALARQKGQLNVTLLLRDPYVCKDINERHINSRYLKEYTLPNNVLATTSFVEAIQGAQYAIHAVPVQHSRKFLESIADVLPPDVPIISVSKGLEVGTGKMMSELIPSALGRKQPAAFLSGPSFAKEIMDLRPTGVVAASKDKKLARELQCLFASPYLRVNTTADVIGVEICGALKNVLALAAGIVEGLDLGHNAMAALVAQGCAEIRWLAEKMGAKPATVSGLSGLGDIMLTCYGSLSRNRSVGVRLGKGEALADILASSNQVAEGVSTAGVVVGLARTYRVSLPVLTAVAQVLAGALSPKEAVYEIMNLPQIEEH